MRSIFSGVVIGAAAAAIGTIIAFKYMNRSAFGGGSPMQTSVSSYNAKDGVLYPVDEPPLPPYVAPVSQEATPITEAAYNQYPVTYEPAFGPLSNQPAQHGEVVLPL